MRARTCLLRAGVLTGWEFRLFVALVLSAAASAAPAENTATRPTHWIPLKTYQRCGPLSLFVLGTMLGYEWDLNELIARCRTDEQGGVSGEELLRVGNELGLELKMVRTNFTGLRDLTPCIAHLKESDSSPAHFSVVAGARPDAVLVIDPPHPNRWVEADRWSDRWEGRVIVPAAPATSESGWPWWRGLFSVVALLVGVACHRVFRNVFGRSGLNQKT